MFMGNVLEPREVGKTRSCQQRWRLISASIFEHRLGISERSIGRVWALYSSAYSAELRTYFMHMEQDTWQILGAGEGH